MYLVFQVMSIAKNEIVVGTCVRRVYPELDFLPLLHPSGGIFHRTLWGCDFRAGMRLSVATLTSSM